MRGACLLLVVLAACSPKKHAEAEAKAKSDAGGMIAGPVKRAQPIAPGSPLQTDKIDFAKIRTDLAAVRAAIRGYRMTNDEKNPPDIGVLDLNLFFPNDLIYDPNTGTVKSRTYPTY